MGMRGEPVDALQLLKPKKIRIREMPEINSHKLSVDYSNRTRLLAFCMHVLGCCGEQRRKN